jgi:serine/threonine-protein kinase
VPDLLRDQLQTTLGAGYTLGRELGGGGMSRVYVAREEAFGRDVVVKVLAPELAEGLSAERFAREIRLVAALQEPHIVPVLTAGVTADGLPYFTMPLVAGESLRSRLERQAAAGGGPLPREEAVRILRDVAEALEYAHARGIVHRDIKPENVLLSGRNALVADFGIAKALQASRTRAPDGLAGGGLTQLGTSLGTPAYMAPEQAAADPAMDHRADLYAWGLVAYELLGGRHPFAGKVSAQQLMAAHFAEVPAPLPPPVPPALAALVARCLAKAPAERPASAANVLEALDGAQSGAYNAGAVPTGRHRRALIGGALGLVVLVLIGGITWRARASATGPEAPPLVAVLPFETAASAAGVVPDSAFADGLGDAITGKLARLSGLRVIDRASVRSVGGAATNPQAAGRALGADYVLRATLRWARGADGQPRVQVSPVLVRVADGTTRWAGEPTVVSPADAFTVQGTLATEVADALDVALVPAERTRLASAITVDTAAFAAIERGKRIRAAGDSISSAERLRRSLLEFESAYRRDPSGAEAWSEASYVLQRMGQQTSNIVLIDSAAVLARRALALDPGDDLAVNTLVVYELNHGRVASARAVVQRAVRAHPSSAELRSLLALNQYQTGDAASAWPTALEALRLAPRSTSVLDAAFATALALRRYADAGELLARRRALEPAARKGDLMAGNLAAALGDSVAVVTAVRAYQAKGGRLRADDPSFLLRTPLQLMRFGDGAMGDALLAGTPATFGAQSGEDTLNLYSEQTTLLLLRGDTARARPLLDCARDILARLAAAVPPAPRGMFSLGLAWLAAARGDRTTADRELSAADTQLAGGVREQSGGQIDGALTCVRAEVAGLLGDVAAMLPPLRRCLTMTNGYPVAWLRTEPAFTRHAADPRVRALDAELTAAEARALRTGVPTDR